MIPISRWMTRPTWPINCCMAGRVLDLWVERIGDFKTGPGVDAADSLSEGFGKDGAGFDADTTCKLLFFNDGNFFSELRCLDGGPRGSS